MRKRKIIGIVICACIILFVSLGILTVFGVISKMAWASLILGLFGKEVEVEDVNIETDYAYFQGIRIPEGVWQMSSSNGELVIENGTATVGIKTYEGHLDEPLDYLGSKAMEVSLDFCSGGLDTFMESSMMFGTNAYTIIAGSEETNYLIMFWYAEDKIYTISALYENIEDANDVIYSIESAN